MRGAMIVAMDRLTWLGHATVLMEADGARLITDPVLRSRVAHLRRHAPPPAAPGRLDAILISHLHHDHLDLPSLQSLDPSAPIVLPRGAARAVRRLRREVREVAPGDEIDIAGARVRVVRADHDGRRLPWTREAETIGFLLDRVYFAGDTEVFGGMADLAGDIDVALLPIWGWGTKLGPGHMDPEEAARAAALLQPARVVPIHWGTFLPIGLHRRHGHLLRDPAQAFTRHLTALAPDVRAEVLAPGESLELA
jgi:L-ascorbate metabolism protein UlaG (beta-lactamase superfamily)